MGDNSGPYYKLMTPGSMMSVAISEVAGGSGIIAVAGGKAVHANDFGNGGDLFAVSVTDFSSLNSEDLINEINRSVLLVFCRLFHIF